MEHLITSPLRKDHFLIGGQWRKSLPRLWSTSNKKTSPQRSTPINNQCLILPFGQAGKHLQTSEKNKEIFFFYLENGFFKKTISF